MWGRIAALMVAIGLAWAGFVLAQAPEIPAEPRYVFPTTPEVIVRLVQPSTVRSIRGKLLSLTASEVVVDSGKGSARDRARGEVGQKISFNRIESLRSLDGQFEFTPDEDFMVISKRVVATYSSVTIERSAASPGTANGSPSPDPILGAPVTPQPTPAKKPAVNGLGQGSFGGIKSLTKPKKTDPVPADIPDKGTPTEGTTEPATTPPVDPTAGATEVLLCSNCTKEIPASAVKTGICPHCKIAFSNVSLPPSKPVQNPFQKPAGAGNAGSGAFAPTGPAPSLPPSVPPPGSGTQVVESSGFSIDAVPNWAKGGLFVLLVLVGWHLVFNR